MYLFALSMISNCNFSIMKTIILTICLSFLILSPMISQNKVEFFGHRGCRGLLPENTIIGFNKALELGADGIEWDVIVNRDNELIISHEPYADAQYCLDTSGEEILKNIEKDFNFHQMSTKQIQDFDCGSKGNPKFPEQQKIKAFKPTVQEAFKSVKLEGKTILFEIKSEEKDYGIFQPEPTKYAEIIAKEVEGYAFKDNIVFMCFDANLLNELHKLLPDFKYVYLTYLPFKSIKSFLTDISFTPYALGMYHVTIKEKDVTKANMEGVKIFAWTVNSEKQCKKLIRYGVEGIITDYPDRIKR